jgi:hypothetical protein
MTGDFELFKQKSLGNKQRADALHEEKAKTKAFPKLGPIEGAWLAVK